MGIDCYLKWNDQTKAENDAQLTGFKVDCGDVGYLREAYHGGPYATRVLLPEGWDEKNYPWEKFEDGIPIKAATLRERLPATVLIAIYRNHVVYGEAEKDPSHIALDEGGSITKTIANVFAGIASAGKQTHELVASITPEQLEGARKLIEKRDLPDFVLSFVDFVELAERIEKEKGEPCRVIVSA